MQRAILLCQGEQSRLADLGHPKQLLRLGNETLLGRTLRMLEAARWPAVVVGRDELREEIAGRAHLLTLEDPGRCVLDALAQLRDLFQGATIRIFLGDVAWSRAAFAAFLADARPFFFAGQSTVSASEGELFGLGFDQTAVDGVMKLLANVPCRRVRYEQGQPGHLRNLLFLASEADRPLGAKLYSWRFLQGVDDWTTDFDKPEDLAKLPFVTRCAADEGRA